MQSRIIRLKSNHCPYPLDMDISQYNQPLKVDIINALNGVKLIEYNTYEKVIISNIIYSYLTEDIKITLTPAYYQQNYNKIMKQIIYDSIKNNNISELYLYEGEIKIISNIIHSYLINISYKPISLYNMNYGPPNIYNIRSIPTYYEYNIKLLINKNIIKNKYYSQTMIKENTDVYMFYPTTIIKKFKIDEYEKINIILHHEHTDASGTTRIESISFIWNQT